MRFTHVCFVLPYGHPGGTWKSLSHRLKPTQPTAAATPDHRILQPTAPGRGSNPHLHSDPSCCSQALRPRHHSRNAHPSVPQGTRSLPHTAFRGIDGHPQLTSATTMTVWDACTWGLLQTTRGRPRLPTDLCACLRGMSPGGTVGSPGSCVFSASDLAKGGRVFPTDTSTVNLTKAQTAPRP